MNKRKNYKEKFLIEIMKVNEKRGQVTIFVIVAMVIVVLIALFFLFRPNIMKVFEGGFSPNTYLTSCVEPEIKPAVEELSNQGGYRSPEGYTLRDGTKIQYLCYTDKYYETCTIQQPMTKQHFEKELNLMLKGKASKCMSSLIEEYKKRGYEVSSGGVNSDVSIVPGKILVTYSAPLTIKMETTQTFNNFEVEMKSEIYDLLFIASSIVEYESKLGDSATELYLQYYPDLKIEKAKLSDGTKIYELSNVVTGEKFKFASRSLAWPAGYGLEQKT